MLARAFQVRFLLKILSDCRFVIVRLLLCAGLAPGAAWGQAQSQTPPEAAEKKAGQDENPTKIVLWSLRNEYYNLPGEPWRNVLLVRGDRAVFRRNPWLRRRGLLLRIDIPFAAVNLGSATRAGLGNIYVQALSIPRLTRKFGIFAGTGLTMPTATDTTLGNRKWVIAPVAGPIWFTRENGFFFIKAQGFLSFAGDKDARSVRLLKLQPFYVLPLNRSWWIQFDTESTTDFANSGHTGFTSGFRVGKLMTPHLAAWVEPRVGWGRYRDADFVMRSSIYWIR